MKALVAVLAICLLLTGCSEENVGTSTCLTPATLRDMSGLDGCGWVFELNDGTKLSPYWLMFCGTPPLPKEITEDPLYNYEYVDGKQVMINYEVMPDIATACMGAEVVKIKCVSDRPSPGNE